MRKVADEDNDDHDSGAIDRDMNIGIPMFRKDNVKDKFNQLRKLDGGFESVDVSIMDI